MTYYVSKAGKDSNPGTQAAPWLTPRTVNNADVYLADGETFDVPASTPISFSGKINATLTGSPTNPATIRGAAASPGAAIGPNIIQWDKNSLNCELSNVIIDSADGMGYGGHVLGKTITINAVQLKNLTEGFDWQGVDGVTILGGKQIGRVAGRCHYFLGCRGFNVNTGVMGPAQGQSPIRFSTDVDGPFVNNSGGSVCIPVTQVGSDNPIACFAIHNAIDIEFVGCWSVGGEFSLDGAGEGVGDVASGCKIDKLTVVNSKLDLNSIAFSNTFTNLTVANPTGECVSVQTVAKAGNVIDGATLTSPVHAAHFYQAGDTVLKNVKYTAAVFIDGAWVKENDGGGNVKVKP